MAKTAKEQAEMIRERKNEYSRMRAALLEIVEASDTANSDRINAINIIMQMDEKAPILQRMNEI